MTCMLMWLAQSIAPKRHACKPYKLVSSVETMVFCSVQVVVGPDAEYDEPY